MNKIKKITDADTAQSQSESLGKNWIRVGMSTCGIAAGADKVFALLREQAAKRNLDLKVEKCGCAGMCYAEPLVEVCVEGLPQVVYGGITEQDAEAIIEGHVINKHLLQDRIYQVKVK